MALPVCTRGYITPTKSTLKLKTGINKKVENIALRIHQKKQYGE